MFAKYLSGDKFDTANENLFSDNSVKTDSSQNNHGESFASFMSVSIYCRKQ